MDLMKAVLAIYLSLGCFQYSKGQRIFANIENTRNLTLNFSLPKAGDVAKGWGLRIIKSEGPGKNLVHLHGTIITLLNNKNYSDLGAAINASYVTNMILQLKFEKLHHIFAGNVVYFESLHINHIIDYCENTTIVVIRKPSTSTIQRSSMIGEELTMVCEGKSTSLPRNHPFPTEIFWEYSDDGTIFSPIEEDKKRFSVRSGNLVVKNLQINDGTKLRCSTADDFSTADEFGVKEQKQKKAKSNYSQEYIVKLERYSTTDDTKSTALSVVTEQQSKQTTRKQPEPSPKPGAAVSLNASVLTVVLCLLVTSLKVKYIRC